MLRFVPLPRVMMKARKKTLAKIHPGRSLQAEVLKLRYFRFKCSDIERTIEFYKSFGMSILYDEMQESIPNANQDPVRVVALSYGEAGGETTSNRVHLLFEDSEQSLPRDNVGHAYEYLLIYVHFLQRLIKRVAGKRFKMILEPTDFDGSLMSIFEDPNGIHVRLVQLSPENLNETKQKGWFARIGFYSLETSLADETVQFYDEIFQSNKDVGSKGKPATPNAKTLLDVPKKTNLRKTGALGVARHVISKSAGFKLVDMDGYLVGLRETFCFFFGNDNRENTTTLCLTEVRLADSGVTITNHSQKSPLVSIGIEVCNLEHMITKLKQESKNLLEWQPMRLKIAGMYKLN
jgi:predicted enzyme related to lactoylglutathione lyase